MSTNDKGYPHHFYGTPDRYRLAESKKAKSERVINYQRIQYKDKEIMISNAEEIGKPVIKDSKWRKAWVNTLHKNICPGIHEKTD
jgi:hypothetical protein